MEDIVLIQPLLSYLSLNDLAVQGQRHDTEPVIDEDHLTRNGRCQRRA